MNETLNLELIGKLMEDSSLKHIRCRSKEPGSPVFKGTKWECSRCGVGYIPGDNVDKDEFFKLYLARTVFN